MKVLTKAKGRTKGERAAKTDIDDGCLAKGSVIVYVWRQRDAEAVAENIQASGVDGGVVVYHGGMDSGARSRSQSMVSTLPGPVLRFFSRWPFSHLFLFGFLSVYAR